MRDAVIFLSLCFGLISATSQAGTIHDAAKKGDVAGITAVLDAGVSVNESDGIAPPLHYAVRIGNLEAVKLLVQRGGDVNAPSVSGTLPLVPAVVKGNAEVIKLLLDHDANQRKATMRSARTFPAPWRVEPTEGGHFVVKDATGFSVCYVYARNESAVRNQYMTPAEALVITQQIAELPELSRGARAI
jgi:Ankyrin repeats (3 copies)